MNTSIAVLSPQDCPVLPPAIAALIARWDASRSAADLIAAIQEQPEQQFADATPINAAKTVKKRGKCNMSKVVGIRSGFGWTFRAKRNVSTAQ
jgi:hypothetical protein